MKKKTVIGIVAVVIVLVILAIVVPYVYFYTWGDEGELTLSISLDKDTLVMNGTGTSDEGQISLRYTLSNEGDTNIRVLHVTGWLRVTDPNGTNVARPGPDYSKPPPPTNRDVEVIKAHESRSTYYTISIKGYDLISNETYKVVGHYASINEVTVTLPYWTGELESNTKTFRTI